jgi:hypothetical protein
MNSNYLCRVDHLLDGFSICIVKFDGFKSLLHVIVLLHQVIEHFQGNVLMLQQRVLILNVLNPVTKILSVGAAWSGVENAKNGGGWKSRRGGG